MKEASLEDSEIRTLSPGKIGESERWGAAGRADAGIARGALDNGHAFLQRARLKRVLDHLQGGAVLDGPAGIELLAFQEDVASGQFAEGGDAQQRCIADEFGEIACCRKGVLMDAHAAKSIDEKPEPVKIIDGKGALRFSFD